MRKKLTAGNIAIIVACIILALISVYPMWYTLILSFSDKAYVDAGKVFFVPRGFNLNAYTELLKDKVFLSSILVSVKRVVVGCSINMIMLVLTAYPLAQPPQKFRARKIYKWFFMANMLFSGGLIPSYVIMAQYKLFNSFWALVLPGAIPLWNMILLIHFFQNVPYTLNEAATIDGATPLQILTRIYIPLSKASLACLLLFQFVGHWNAYFDGLIYINDKASQPLQTYIYQISTQVNYQTMTPEEILNIMKTSNKTLNAAKVIIALVPIMCVYPFLQKHFVKGMNLGAVKE